jgi:hypothetical protein
MKIVWKTAAAVAFLALVSCGGGGNAALSKNFNYGAPQAPSTAEQSAATSAQGTVSTSSSFGSSPSGTAASSIVGMADQLATSAFGGAALGAAGLTQEDPHLRRALRTAVTDACTTVTATSVTFTNCQDTQSGYSFTLNGTVSASNGTITWDIHGSFAGTNQGYAIALGLHQSGTLAVTSTTVKGKSLSEISGNVSGNGQSVSFGVDTAAMIDLTYDPTCITSGTIEVKRVWSEKPNGASGPDFADVAVKLSWTGCNTVQAQHST